MPRKVRDLIRDLPDAGFIRFRAVAKARIESFRTQYSGAVTLFGAAGEDAKHYQEKQVRRAIERLKK